MCADVTNPPSYNEYSMHSKKPLAKCVHKMITTNMPFFSHYSSFKMYCTEEKNVGKGTASKVTQESVNAI